MAPSEDLSKSNPRTRRSGPNYGMLVPLIYAPILPLLRLGLNKRVSNTVRDRVFGGAVLLALAHAGYVISGDSTMGAGS